MIGLLLAMLAVVIVTVVATKLTEHPGSGVPSSVYSQLPIGNVGNSSVSSGSPSEGNQPADPEDAPGGSEGNQPDSSNGADNG